MLCAICVSWPFAFPLGILTTFPEVSDLGKTLSVAVVGLNQSTYLSQLTPLEAVQQDLADAFFEVDLHAGAELLEDIKIGTA